MIIDKLENYNIYLGIHNNLIDAFKYLKNLDIDCIQPEKYEIKNDELYAIISEYETSDADEGLWESHKKYIDIHYISEGAEKIGYSHIDNLNVTHEYDCTNDVILGRAHGDFITLNKGTFIILFPDDAHKSGIKYKESNNVKKVILKLKR